jgi:hypothetical protein
MAAAIEISSNKPTMESFSTGVALTIGVLMLIVGANAAITIGCSGNDARLGSN